MSRHTADRAARLPPAWHWVEIATRFTLAGVFLYAAFGKLTHATDFVEQVANYHFLPELSPWVAVIVPSVEVVASLVLMLAPASWRQAAALVIAGLLVVFSFAVARAWALGIDAECGCFGSSSSAIGPWPLLRNAGLLALSLGLILLNHPRLELRLPRAEGANA